MPEEKELNKVGEMEEKQANGYLAGTNPFDEMSHVQ